MKDIKQKYENNVSTNAYIPSVTVSIATFRVSLSRLVVIPIVALAAAACSARD